MATSAIGFPLAGAFDSAMTSQHAFAHAGRDARAAAVAAAWNTGSSRLTLAPPSAEYAAAAAARRRNKAAATVLPQGLPTTTPLTPETSRKLYQTSAGSDFQMRHAPSLSAASFPGAPQVQHPLAAAFGQGSQMYATGIAHNGAPSLSTPADSAAHFDGEFAGTFMDPITGVTYASYMLRDQAPTVQRDTPVMRLGEPSRALEFLTGVSHVPKPVRTDNMSDDWETVADGIQVPESISRAAIRAREAQESAAQVFFTRDNQETPVNDTFWDGYVGDTYVLRTWTDTQTMSDNAEFNLSNMQSAQPDFPNWYLHTNVGAHAGGERAATFTLSAEKPSQPGHSTISMDDMGPGILTGMAPMSERVGRAQLAGAITAPVLGTDIDAVARSVLANERTGKQSVMARPHHMLSVADSEWAGDGGRSAQVVALDSARDTIAVRPHVHVDMGHNWAGTEAAPAGALNSTRDTLFTSGNAIRPDLAGAWEASPALTTMALESARVSQFVPGDARVSMDDTVYADSAHRMPVSVDSARHDRVAPVHLSLDTHGVADWAAAASARDLPARRRTTAVGIDRASIDMRDVTDGSGYVPTSAASDRFGRRAVQSQPRLAVAIDDDGGPVSRTVVPASDKHTTDTMWTARADLALAAQDDGGGMHAVRGTQANDARPRAERVVANGHAFANDSMDAVNRPAPTSLDATGRQERTNWARALVAEPYHFDGGNNLAAAAPGLSGLAAFRDTVHVGSGRGVDLVGVADIEYAATRDSDGTLTSFRDTVHVGSGRNTDGSEALEVRAAPAVAGAAHRLRAGENGEAARPSTLEMDMELARSMPKFRDVASVRNTTVHAGGQQAIVDAWHYARQAYAHPETHGTGAFTRQTVAPVTTSRTGMFEHNLAAAYVATDPGRQHVEAAAAKAAASAAAAAASRAPIMDATAVAYESAYDYETE
jgi:hypothetical protein